MGDFELELAAWPSGMYRSVRANVVTIPFPILLTGLIPFAAGAIWRFRFPLWSWFLLIAVIAAQMAFYAQVNRVQNSKVRDESTAKVDLPGLRR